MTSVARASSGNTGNQENGWGLVCSFVIGWIVSPQKICANLDPQYLTSFGNIGFADEIKVK